MKISIIIPTLNEAGELPATLDTIARLSGDFDVLVVDGGSSDATVELARSMGVRTLTAPPGRAAQMNAGAATATGDVLLFLHADTRLPEDAFAAISAALADERVAGGCFRLRFDHHHPVLRFSSLLTRSGLRLVHFGDSAYFVRRETFHALGGYRSIEIMEDLDFWLRMCRAHATRVVQSEVVTSARRFLKHGVVRQQGLAALLGLMFLAGFDPARLRKIYLRSTTAHAELNPVPAPAAATARAGFNAPTLWERLFCPVRTLWHWTYSNLHLAKQTWHVLDFIYLSRVGPRRLADDHPWVTGRIPNSGETIWKKNIVFASERSRVWRNEAEEDDVIVTHIGRFLSSMVARSNKFDPEIPQGTQRRMPHAVNYIHGSIHYNGGFLIFNDIADAMRHFSDPGFVREFKRFACAERRELTVVLREREYHPEEYAWFVAFIRARQPWFANGNGPTKKRVLYGTPSPYPAVNPINGSWVTDVGNIQRGRMEKLVRQPIRTSAYFNGTYCGHQSEFTFLERFHAWSQHVMIVAKGFQGGLVFTTRKKIEPENLRKYRQTRGAWRASYAVSHPFMSIDRVRRRRSLRGTEGLRRLEVEGR